MPGFAVPSVQPETFSKRTLVKHMPFTLVAIPEAHETAFSQDFLDGNNFSIVMFCGSWTASEGINNPTMQL